MAQTQQYQTIKPEQVQTGMQIRVHQRISEQTAKGMKERVQVFEGLVITVRGKDEQKTMTVRKVSNGVGVEKIFPLALPTLEKIELMKQFKVRRKNIGFLKSVKKRLKDATIKLRPVKEEQTVEAPTEEPSEEPAVETQAEEPKAEETATETPAEAAPAEEEPKAEEAKPSEEAEPATEEKAEAPTEEAKA